MKVFTPFESGDLRLKNRIVRSATAEAMAEDGFVTEELIELYKKLTEGGSGMIITGYMFVSGEGKAMPKMTGISGDQFVDGLKRLVAEVKKVDKNVFFVAQIAHAGRQTKISPPVAPSAVYDPSIDVMPRELTKEEIERIIEDFKNAVLRADKAGFDGVQLHCAHGYLLSEFLSPHTNKRKDEYGDGVRVILEIIERAREKTKIPILVKMNAHDFIPGGLELKDSIKIAKRLNDFVSAIEVSGGMYESNYHNRYNVVSQKVHKSGEAYFAKFAIEIKKEVSVPVIAVGGIRSIEVAEKLLESVDLIAMSRPLIRDPYLPMHWTKSDCVSCNRCLNAVAVGEKLRCYKNYNF
ncbi:MAG: NADH:flavin oxidoreductase [Archaeoglobales archaeon]|nr:NADH:flavin oxidoreductase [Archaeoglobales archaeon]